jgi:hypothetical protein
MPRLACASRPLDVLYPVPHSGGVVYHVSKSDNENATPAPIVPADACSIFIVASTALGWCLEANAPLAATLVVNFFIGFGSGSINLATVYGQDLKPGNGGAVSASVSGTD